MAGCHRGLGGAPVPLLHPLLYIAPHPTPAPHPPPPCLFKRYFHSWRVLYRQIKADYLYRCVLECGLGTDTGLGGYTEPGWGKGPSPASPSPAGHPSLRLGIPFSWAAPSVGPALPPRTAQDGGCQGWQGWGQRVRRDPKHTLFALRYARGAGMLPPTLHTPAPLQCPLPAQPYEQDPRCR